MNNPELANWLSERLDRLETKLDSVHDRLTNVDVTLGRQASDLEYHIKRTDLLEIQVTKVVADLLPIKNHVEWIKGIAWLMGVVVVFLGAMATLRSLLS